MPNIPTLLAHLHATQRAALAKQFQALLTRCPLFAAVVQESR